MSKMENNRIYYDPYNEIRCDKFALEKFVKESEEKDKIIADLKAKLAGLNKEQLNCSQLENGMSLCIIQKGKIAELSAKLAESEERVKDLEFGNKNLEHSLKVAPNANAGQRKRIDDLTKENKQLRQQLAKNEEMIEKLKDESVKYYCAAFNYKERLKQLDQDKISFAVEQLEKVKEYIERDKDWKVFAIAGLIKNQIDNQIKELKKGK